LYTNSPKQGNTKEIPQQPVDNLGAINNDRTQALAKTRTEKLLAQERVPKICANEWLGRATFAVIREAKVKLYKGHEKVFSQARFTQKGYG
jgi:hypothetical protein